ncbi:MAG: hypothetical protein AMJ92_09555 [candidate division Zixibacteria bacterium SM23_81]|nr:MAG: hypothetical protein AMJ92_09555 [candidate division Zixibacteria bacterium SM23_81]
MPIYSHSRLETYQDCPLQYKFQYVDRLQRKKQGIEAFLGSRVHETLEKLYRDLLNGKRNEPADLLNHYEEQWNRHWKEGRIKIVRREYTPEDYCTAGRECIEKYYTHYSPFDGDTTLGVEVRVNFSLNHDGRYRMKGFIDRLARGKDGIWEIHDYKTSSALPTQEDVDEQPQLALYQIGVQQKWPQIQQVNLVWHYLRFDTALSTTWTVSRLQELQQRTMKLIDEIEADRDFNPRESNLCDWCDFQDNCPLKMHPLKISTLRPKEFRADDGVRLVDQYADLKDQEREIRARIDEIKKQLIAYSRQEGVRVISGSEHLVNILFQKKFKFPESADKRRKELEALLHKAAKWNEISSLSSLALDNIIRKGEWEPELLQKVKEFAKEEEESQVRLRKKQKEK